MNTTVLRKISEIISTNKNSVMNLSTDVRSANESVKFNPTYSINRSTSPATDEFKSLITSFQQTLETYKNCMTTEVSNVEAVHEAMEDADNKIKNNISNSMQA